MNSPLNYFTSFDGVSCRIAFAVLLWRYHFKRFIVSEHCKDDVTNLVHHSPNSYVLLLGFAFVGVIAVNDWIYRHPTACVYLKIIERHHMQDAPGQTGTPFWHMYLVPVEFPRLLYGRGQTDFGSFFWIKFIIM